MSSQTVVKELGMSTQGNIGVWPMDPMCDPQCMAVGVAPFSDMTNITPRPNWLDLEGQEVNLGADKCNLTDSVESLRMQLASKLSTVACSFPSPSPLDLYPQDADSIQCTHVHPSVAMATGTGMDGRHHYAKSFDAAVNLARGTMGVQQHEDMNIWKPNCLANAALSVLDGPRVCLDTAPCVCRHRRHSEENLMQSLPRVNSTEQVIEKPWTTDISELIRQGMVGLDDLGFDPLEFDEAGSALKKAGVCADSPSGPRKCGQGTEDSIQSIVAIEKVANDCIVVNVTLLVSGFIIGPKGASIREIQKRTGAQIRSFNKRPSLVCARILRTFSIQGTQVAQSHAVDIIKAAITRYKYLAEGPCNGQRVSHIHTIFGIDFFYSPPPKSIVPHAAGLDPLEDCGIRPKQGVSRLQDIFNHGLQ